jgi:hypothetical protein
MLGFGKKETAPLEKPVDASASIPVTAIPADFYGGANPTITFKEVAKVITAREEGTMTPGDKKALDSATAAGSGAPLHPASVASSHKKIALLGGGLFVLFVAGAAGYYFLTAKKPTPKPVAKAPQIAVPVEPVPVISSTPVVAEPVITPPAPPQTISDARLEFPSILLGRSADLDNDGLTDLEEEIFSTDTTIPDTDEDTHTDSTEVFFLYNPNGKEPIRLIESAVVKEYVNPAVNYRLYYPATWLADSIDAGFLDVLFSTANGDNIEVRVFEKDSNQSFADWFAVNAPQEQYGSLVDFETRFGDKALRRSDKLVYYFVSGSRVYVMVYHATNATIVSYPAVLEMMARSFRVDGQSFIVPPQQPLTVVPEPAPAESGAITTSTLETTTTTQEAPATGITL